MPVVEVDLTDEYEVELTVFDTMARAIGVDLSVGDARHVAALLIEKADEAEAKAVADTNHPKVTHGFDVDVRMETRNSVKCGACGAELAGPGLVTLGIAMALWLSHAESCPKGGKVTREQYVALDVRDPDALYVIDEEAGS